ncbi:multivesicular body subunit 12Bb isoform X4 [Notolabrus celidotus]|uniref:multivesicular body subunit 12Bb isoform X4 n=1 Tax=Notolabrus celidotus TaxID=1203425 RepID=UPI0014906D72|nr:multivesicular body subunit 12Bb isoform X4 [Notolabrus celidotus]
MFCCFNMSEVTDQYFTEPITAVGVICSPNKAPDDYYVVAQTTDGSDADLWKDGLFKSKVTRYLCFTRKTGPEVVVDMKLIDIKDVLPEGFTPVEETMDTKETAMRKRRMCVKMSPRAAAEKAVNDIKITAKSKNHLVNYTCMGDINNMGLWYGVGVASQQQSTQQTSSRANSDAPPGTIRQRGGDVARRANDSCGGREESSKISAILQSVRRTTNRPTYEHQGSGTYTMTALDDVPFVISEKFGERRFKEMQQVNLMGITIKSLAEIEEEFYYNFTTERSIAV